jgi:hypothetical protein
MLGLEPPLNLFPTEAEILAELVKWDGIRTPVAGPGVDPPFGDLQPFGHLIDSEELRIALHFMLPPALPRGRNRLGLESSPRPSRHRLPNRRNRISGP